jgi:hypothetical protein
MKKSFFSLLSKTDKVKYRKYLARTAELKAILG